MKYSIIAPTGVLKRYVKHISMLDYNNPIVATNKIKVFADRFPHLVIQHNNGKSAYYKDNIALPTIFLCGIKTTPYTCDIHHIHRATTFTFYPHAIKTLFGIDAFELNDVLPGIENFIPNITELLLNCTSHERIINVVSTFLTKKIVQLKSDPLLIEHIVERINSVNHERSIRLLLNHYKFSERKLERLFKYEIGITPQLYLKATRFEKSLELIRQNKYDNLSDVAYDLNYTDQSHFIKDFKRFSGFTPKKLITQDFIVDNNSCNLSSANAFVNINHIIVH